MTSKTGGSFPLPIRIVLERPPTGVDFGLQQGSGKKYITVQTKRSDGANLSFSCVVEVRSGPPDVALDFYGEVVQGQRGNRFIYIDIGSMAGQVDSCWSRRLKIRLSQLTARIVNAALAGTDQILECRLPGADESGGPTCATTHPSSAWRIAQR